MTWSEDRGRQLREAIEGSEEEGLLPLAALLLLAAVIMLVAGWGG